MKTILTTNFEKLKLINRGKVRDIYEVEEYLLIVATDRVSAFDVVMDEPIPYKGYVLSQISVFWFEKTKGIINNHFISNIVSEYPEICHQYKEELEGRSMLVKKCKPLALECIARGYITGSGWKEYLQKGTITDIPLPKGLIEFDKLPEAIFTPSTKAEEGHDENINFEMAVEIVGKELAEKLKEVTLNLYKFSADYLNENNIILADTKFEFGIDNNGELILIDEAITPDSSRFWLKEHWEPGKSQYNFDKQVLRDWLIEKNWNKQPPAPNLPLDLIQKCSEVYKEALNRIIK